MGSPSGPPRSPGACLPAPSQAQWVGRGAGRGPQPKGKARWALSSPRPTRPCLWPLEAPGFPERSCALWPGAHGWRWHHSAFLHLPSTGFSVLAADLVSSSFSIGNFSLFFRTEPQACHFQEAFPDSPQGDVSFGSLWHSVILWVVAVTTGSVCLGPNVPAAFSPVPHTSRCWAVLGEQSSEGHSPPPGVRREHLPCSRWPGQSPRTPRLLCKSHSPAQGWCAEGRVWSGPRLSRYISADPTVRAMETPPGLPSCPAKLRSEPL